jgi:hypothetical protein
MKLSFLRAAGTAETPGELNYALDYAAANPDIVRISPA